MNLNYDLPIVPQEWADSRETSMIVAVAIHAIADSSRSPQQIWEAPTPAEWDHVTIAIAEYIDHGDFDTAGYPTKFGFPEFQWGLEPISPRPVTTSWKVA